MQEEAKIQIVDAQESLVEGENNILLTFISPQVKCLLSQLAYFPIIAL